MASIKREVPISARSEHVWDALRDVGALHQRLAPGFVTEARLEEGASGARRPHGRAADLIPDLRVLGPALDEVRLVLLVLILDERLVGGDGAAVRVLELPVFTESSDSSFTRTLNFVVVSSMRTAVILAKTLMWWRPAICLKSVSTVSWSARATL